MKFFDCVYFMRFAVAFFLSTVLTMPAVASEEAAPSWSQESNLQREDLVLGGQLFAQMTLTRNDAPPLRFYISKPPRRAPLLLYIQGSGCSPVFILGSQPASTVFSLVPTALEGQFAVMVVDKPSVPKRPPATFGTAVDCPKEFNEYFSRASWSRDLHEALVIARTLDWVDSSRTMVLGFSEGAVMAADLAGSDPAITDVAMLGVTGPSQLFDFIVRAYRDGKSDQDVIANIEDVERSAREIASDPNNAAKFVWGHPYKRWSGFLSTSSIKNLMSSQARMYLVSGMGDENVPILSTEALYAELRAAGKRVTMRRLPNASHSLLPAGAKDYGQLNDEIKRILTWFGANN